MRKLKILTVSFAFTQFFILLSSQPVSNIAAAIQQNRKANPDELTAECGPLESLDRVVQERFRKIDNRFGRYRVTPATLHINYFTPETPEEKQVLDDLVASGWEVAFYLAGRQILSSQPAKGERNLSEPRRNMAGPIYMTPPYVPEADLPEHYELLEHAKNALKSFARKDEYNFKIGRWTYLARPIRAQEYCLSCHNNAKPEKIATPRIVTSELDLNRENARSNTPIKVGDALGVAIYAYTRTKTKQPKR